ncbi:hypothetical protein AMJ39_08235 [candidate division TA06 bacterium DG_24]|uniref:GIY-YIG domain-containing protein n=1 Tax=candidate division TA06 bacterium DG_24 TaxID=1703770 RepID=A0A0S7WQ62_UNCT6|nr:MAG: hypothetical protein AMJ39_08235 [candidate division TA06 bacterium DG_24]
MAKIGTVTFTGQSGTKYEFAAYPWGTAFKDDYAAVYFVTERYKEAKGGFSHRHIYVGETEELGIRFENHHKAECFEEESANCICVYGEDDEDERLAIEQDLLAKYDPPCND